MENPLAVIFFIFALIVLIVYARFFVVVALAIYFLILGTSNSCDDKDIAKKNPTSQSDMWKGKLEQ